MHISPLIGLCTGFIPMIGGHGTAGAFGPVLEESYPICFPKVDDKVKDEHITYENVAVPEVHIWKFKK